MADNDQIKFETVVDLLSHLQRNLSVPKSRHNKFGGYNYRSCEDILDAVKSMLPDGATLMLCDDPVLVGDRYYIKSTATLSYNGGLATVESFAREEETKKGMDAAQITGSTSSYARKYALNGLFCIDDVADADASNTHGKEAMPEVNPQPKPQASPDQKAQKAREWLVDFTEKLTKATDMDALTKLIMSTAAARGRIADNYPDLVQGMENAMENAETRIKSEGIA